MKQEQIDKIILDFELHVLAESLQGEASIDNCNVSDWPALVSDTERLTDLLWDMTVFATFGSYRLTEMIWDAWYTMMKYVPHDADETTMVMMWDRKIKTGPPSHVSPDFKKWMAEAMALVVSFINKVGQDEVFLMEGALD